MALRYPAAPYSPEKSGRHPMSTDPTTKSQVQAYRFVLRRMESALVRKDAVMLHEPMRHHLRATAVGLILGLLGLAAFFVVGKFRPVNAAITTEVIIGNPAETVYVVEDVAWLVAGAV
jgi:hypothetical protein